MRKGNQWGYTVMEAIGSTCIIRKLTGKGQVKGKHRSKANGHQTLKQKGNQGQGGGYHAKGSAVCVWKWHKASGNLREGLVRL